MRRIGGKRFSRLLAIERLGGRWKCLCVCGKYTTVRTADIINGHTRSCGCLMRESRHLANFKHGFTGSREYIAWKSMHQRCRDKNRKDWADYGGRNIKVTPRWSGPNGFCNFIADLGLKPSPYHSLDRKNVNKNYELGNVRWATPKQQARNRRKRRWRHDPRTIRDAARQVAFKIESEQRKRVA